MKTTGAEKEVIKQYEKLASRYDFLYPEFLKVTSDKISKLIKKKRGQKILDIACGTGELLLKISNSFPDAQLLVGTDLSKAMLNKAEQKLKNCPNVEFLQASAETIPYPYPDNFFDTIVSSGAMHYMNDVQTVLQEIKRILAIDGSCIVVDMASGFFSTWFVSVFRKMLDPGATKFYSLELMEKLVRGKGFKIISSQLFRAGIFGLYLIEFKK